MYDKEKVYDEEISPLMAEIIKICKRENLPMAAQFYLKKERAEHDEFPGEPMYCTTTIIPAKNEMDADAHDWLKNVATAMRYGPSGPPYVMAATIKTS
ncbi:hypothetical protein [Cytobacillus solani]|uniref:Uncharacterized protein n=1 Tax=Cytobacillus solani TaxID=1637975 RepID=A0A0Q3QIR2_9BACI|nr:hypothetical protein [Cytobacillus solani]KQL17665.1 hypothetical protein AN957_02910 [Cytobacillus solani]KQL20492.1 hypothetical protein AN957_19150 [Cytobacillus solani]